MDVPRFLLRKLYKKGSLFETDRGFSFKMQNPLATATLTSPPTIVVNGINYNASDVQCEVDLTKPPILFAKGTEWTLAFPGHLLRGGNRIHFEADTKEFGTIDFLVEDAATEP
ncbi:MAG: hypothetical protein ACPHK8_07150 [Thermoplasmatota archaeon]